MAQGPRSRMLVRMSEQTISISLELRLTGDSLAGRARNGTGADREFTGWIGLLAAIDALTSSNASPQESTFALIQNIRSEGA
jgi:hypothetical protein